MDICHSTSTTGRWEIWIEESAEVHRPSRWAYAVQKQQRDPISKKCIVKTYTHGCPLISTYILYVHVFTYIKKIKVNLKAEFWALLLALAALGEDGDLAPSMH